MILLPVRAFVIFFLGSVLAMPVAAQTTPAAPKPTGDAPSPTILRAQVAPLRIQVVLARYKGDQRVSSLPYTMSVNAARLGVAQMRMGADVPISSSLAVAPDGPVPASLAYDQIGTQIDCRVTPTEDGRYLLELTVSDKTVYGRDEGPQVARPAGNPTFRSFRSNNAVVLRDGQSTEFAAATDRLTGEIVRVEVSLQVVK